MQDNPAASTWDNLSPQGAIRFYEGDDPGGFAAEINAEFGFDVTESGENLRFHHAWDEESGFSFFIPPGYVEAIYGSERWPLGS